MAGRHSQYEHLREARESTLQRDDLNAKFGRWAAATARGCGSPLAFFLAVLSVVAWGIVGPTFHYSDTWQLVINTATTVVTFLIVFLIQNTQNRDARALHLKLDELIRALTPADNEMMDIEQLSETELNDMKEKYGQLRAKHMRRQDKKDPAA